MDGFDLKEKHLNMIHGGWLSGEYIMENGILHTLMKLDVELEDYHDVMYMHSCKEQTEDKERSTLLQL